MFLNFLLCFSRDRQRKACNRRRQKLEFGTIFEELSKEEAERALLQLSATSSSLVWQRYANVTYRLKIRLSLVKMNILRDCFIQSSLQLTSYSILSQSISLSNLLSFRFTLSYTSSMSLPLTHSQNTFPVRETFMFFGSHNFNYTFLFSRFPVKCVGKTKHRVSRHVFGH